MNTNKEVSKSWIATAALITSVISIIGTFFVPTVLALLVSVVAIILGIIAIKKDVMNKQQAKVAIIISVVFLIVCLALGSIAFNILNK